MRTLDRSRPYGEVYPTGQFEQDNILFDRAGNEIAPPPPEPVVVEEAPPEARKIDLRLKENAHLRPGKKAA